MKLNRKIYFNIIHKFFVLKTLFHLNDPGGHREVAEGVIKPRLQAPHFNSGIFVTSSAQNQRKWFP